MLPISRKTSLWPMHPTLLNNPIQTPWKARFPGHYLYKAILWLSLCVQHPGGNSGVLSFAKFILHFLQSLLDISVVVCYVVYAKLT